MAVACGVALGRSLTVSVDVEAATGDVSGGDSVLMVDGVAVDCGVQAESSAANNVPWRRQRGPSIQIFYAETGTSPVRVSAVTFQFWKVVVPKMESAPGLVPQDVGLQTLSCR